MFGILLVQKQAQANAAAIELVTSCKSQTETNQTGADNVECSSTSRLINYVQYTDSLFVIIVTELNSYHARCLMLTITVAYFALSAL